MSLGTSVLTGLRSGDSGFNYIQSPVACTSQWLLSSLKKSSFKFGGDGTGKKEKMITLSFHVFDFAHENMPKISL